MAPIDLARNEIVLLGFIFVFRCGRAAKKFRYGRVAVAAAHVARRCARTASYA